MIFFIAQDRLNQVASSEVFDLGGHRNQLNIDETSLKFGREIGGQRAGHIGSVRKEVDPVVPWLTS